MQNLIIGSGRSGSDLDAGASPEASKGQHLFSATGIVLMVCRMLQCSKECWVEHSPDPWIPAEIVWEFFRHCLPVHLRPNGVDSCIGCSQSCQGLTYAWDASVLD